MAIKGIGRPSTRPTVYDQDVADEIERLMADEGLNLKQISKLPHMPSMSTIFRWRYANPEFENQCARGKESIAENYFNDLDQIQRDMSEAESELEISILRARQNAVQWLVIKAGPKNYGDKREMLVSGNANAPLRVETTTTLDVSTLSVAQLEALEGALRATVYALDAPKDERGVIEGEIVEEDQGDEP